jgi:glycosyltransferase involved in cell wall biosynthesis
MRLLLFNLATDEDDPILGFTTRWIRALAARLDFIHVVTMRMGRIELPNNVRVYSVGKERGYSEPRRVIEFYKILAQIVREERVDVCFSHMNPLFTVLAGPFLRFYKIPIVTWYAHPKATWILKVAHRLSDRMVASFRTSYPYKHDKLSVIGQGIDTQLFSPRAQALTEDPPIILCVGRLSPVKDHSTLIEAAALLRQKWNRPFRVVIVGGPATSRDEPYVLSLRQQVKRLGLGDTVCFEPAITLNLIPEWYRRCTVYVNMTSTGSGDKVVWEAMACGAVCVVANAGFKEMLGSYADRCLYDFGNPEQLVERLNWVLSLLQTERAQMGAVLRRQVESMHGLSGLADRLVNIFISVRHCKKIPGPMQKGRSQVNG